MSRPDFFKESDILSNMGSNVKSTSAGPTDRVRFKQMASTYSKNSFIIEVKGVAVNSLMSDLEVCIPIKVRWKQSNNQILVANAYSGAANYGRAIRNAGGDREVTHATNMHYFDNIALRPGGLYKSCRSITCAINGTSFSTRPKMWCSAIERLFVDGTEDVCYGGWGNDKYPYSNVGDDREQLNEKGRYKRCKDLSKEVYFNSSAYAAADPGDLNDITYSYVLRTKVPLGPFLFQQFPHLAKFDGNKAAKSYAYIGNLTLQFDLEDNPLPYWFSYPSSAKSDTLSVTNPYLYNALAMDDLGTREPDLNLMWTQASVGEDLGGVGVSSVAIGRPYADYIFSSPGYIQLQDHYLLAGKQFVAYEDFQPMAAGNSKATFSWSNIKVSQVPQLVICYVEDADVSVGDNVGARQAKHLDATPAKVRMRKGGAWSNLWSRIDYRSVRIQVSTRNSVLANLTGEALGIGEKSQYNVFRKYTQGRTGQSFAEWRETSMALIFGAEELNLDVYGSAYEALTLSISFDAYKSSADVGLDLRQIGVQQNNRANPTAGLNAPSLTTPLMVGRMVMMQATEISLQENSCDKKQVYYPAGVAKAFVMSQTQKVEHGAPNSQLQGYQNA